MLELNVDITDEKLRSQGFIHVRKLSDKRFPQDTWRYERGDAEICLVVEVDNKMVRPIRYVNLETRETRGYSKNGR